VPRHLILLILLGAFFRLIYIYQFPPSLNWDEVSLGYNAYSLLKTGRDEWGSILPTIFRAYGDFKLPGYIYSAIPSISIFGLNPLGVRFPSIVSGILMIAAVYLLSRRVSSRFMAILTALLVAISPWPLFLSRVAVEANLAILLFTLGATLLLYRRLFLGIFLLGLSAWTYNSFRIFTPLFLFSYLLLNRKNVKINFLTVAVTLLLFIPVFIQLLSPSGQARFKWLTLLDEGATVQINQLRSRPGGRLLYNKATYLAYRFSVNYLNHFNPKFLFISGGSHYQFSIPNYGLLYLVALPFFYLGLIALLFKFKKSNFKLIIVWLLLAPIPGSLTRDSPHVLRAITMLPATIVVTSMGIWTAAKKFNVLQIALPVILLLSLEYYINPVSANYQTRYSWAWQYGYKEAVQFVKDHYSQYDQIVFTKRYGEPHEFVAFYWPWEPANFSKSKNWDFHDNWYWVNKLDKIKFVNDWEMSQAVASLPIGPKYLVISSPDNETPGTVLTRINFLDSKPAFIIKEL